MRRWILGSAIVVIAVVIALVIGLGVVAVLNAGGGTTIVDLDVGDCFDLPDDVGDDGAVSSVDILDCADPHLAEVVGAGELNPDDTPYPSDAELFAQVERECRAIAAVSSDDFGLLPIAPTLELWESFDGRFLCVAIPFGGEPVTGSIVTG